MHDKRLVLSLTNEGGNLLSSMKGHSLGRNFVGTSVARSVTITRPGLPVHRPRVLKVPYGWFGHRSVRKTLCRACRAFYAALLPDRSIDWDSLQCLC